MSEFLEKIRKIREMAEHGGGTEQDRIHAENKLNELLIKHNLTREEVFKEEPDQRCTSFWFQDNFHREILYGCYCSITNLRQFPMMKEGNHRVWLSVTAWEEIELRAMVDYYKKLWTKQLKDVSVAFVVKHRLYAQQQDEEDDKEPVDREKVYRIRSIVDGMQDGNFVSTKHMLPEGQNEH